MSTPAVDLKEEEDHPGTGRPADLVSIGAAAVALGVSERALRYYQQLGLISCGRTPGGTRRYSEADLARVARIRELQSLLGLELDEIALVLANDDRLAEYPPGLPRRAHRGSGAPGAGPGVPGPAGAPPGHRPDQAGSPGKVPG